MNNEEKILAMLEQLTVGQTKLEAGQIAMQADINRLDKRVDGIHQTVAELDTRVNGIHQTVAELDTGVNGIHQTVTKLDTCVEDIHQTLAKLEIENEQAHGGIHDKLDIIENRTDIIAEDIGIIKERVDAGELYIRLFNKKLNQA